MLQIENTDALFAATLFGEFEVWVNGQCITTERRGGEETTFRLQKPAPPLTRKGKNVQALNRKDRLMLALLILYQGEPTDRNKLAGNLWSDAKEFDEAKKREKTFRRMRESLSRCRAHFRGESIRIPDGNNTRQLQINLAEADVDIVCFDNAVRSGKPEDLKRAYDLYKGPLLQEFFLEENIASESGLTDVEEAICREIRQARSRYARSFSDLCQQLAQQARKEDYTTAAVFLRRGIDAFPLNEAAHHDLMELEGERGNTTEVISLYNNLCAVLRKRGLEPAPETKALHAQFSTARKQAISDRPVARTLIGSVPRPRTGLIGREEARDEICSLIRIKNCRLVTLTGAGGIGKSRLAIAVAEKMRTDATEDYPDGPWFVELASITHDTDPEIETRNLLVRIAGTLNIRQEGDQTWEEALRANLQWRKMLLVLDNCEHLLDAVKLFIEDLLDQPHCGDVAILVTSRVVLKIEGEWPYPVPVLPFPPPLLIAAEGKDKRSQLMEYEAVRLLDERAEMQKRQRSRDPGVMLQEAVAMAQICARLEGIPLAIELAAARFGDYLSFQQINESLSHDFKLLDKGVSGAPRHRTLRAVIEWSYKRLTLQEKALMQRLTVFSGGWTPEAAAAVVSDRTVVIGETASDTPRIAAADVHDLLSSLADHSLIEVSEYPSGLRCRFLETIREFAAEELGKCAELQDVDGWRIRHRDWFLQFAERTSPKLLEADPSVWLECLDDDHANLLSALDLFAESCETEHFLRLTRSLWRYWRSRGRYTEGRHWLNLALQQSAAEISEIKANALLDAGVLASDQGDYETARSLLENSLSIYNHFDNKAKIAYIYNSLGCIMKGQGNYPRATEYLSESKAVYKQIGDDRGMSYPLTNLGDVAIETDDYVYAHKCYTESLELRKKLTDQHGVAYSLLSLGNLARAQKDNALAQRKIRESLDIFKQLEYPKGVASALISLASALPDDEENLVSMRGLYEEALAINGDLGDKKGEACARSNLGDIMRKLRDYAASHTSLKEGLTIGYQIGNRREIAYALEYMAWLAMAQEDTFRAAKLTGAAEALREATGCKLTRVEQEEYDNELKTLRSRMGEVAFTSGRAEGKRLELKEAVSFALESRY